MFIAYRIDPGDDGFIHEYPFRIEEGTKCFYCSKALGAPAVQWSSAQGDLFLHAGCAVELMIRLMRDIHDLECLYGTDVTKSADDYDQRFTEHLPKRFANSKNPLLRSIAFPPRGYKYD